MKPPGWPDNHLVVLVGVWGGDSRQGTVTIWVLPVPHGNPAPGTELLWYRILMVRLLHTNEPAPGIFLLTKAGGSPQRARQCICGAWAASIATIYSDVVE